MAQVSTSPHAGQVKLLADLLALIGALIAYAYRRTYEAYKHHHAICKSHTSHAEVKLAHDYPTLYNLRVGHQFVYMQEHQVCITLTRQAITPCTRDNEWE